MSKSDENQESRKDRRSLLKRQKGQRVLGGEEDEEDNAAVEDCGVTNDTWEVTTQPLHLQETHRALRRQRGQRVIGEDYQRESSLRNIDEDSPQDDTGSTASGMPSLASIHANSISQPSLQSQQIGGPLHKFNSVASSLSGGSTFTPSSGSTTSSAKDDSDATKQHLDTTMVKLKKDMILESETVKSPLSPGRTIDCLDAAPYNLKTKSQEHRNPTCDVQEVDKKTENLLHKEIKAETEADFPIKVIRPIMWTRRNAGASRPRGSRSSLFTTLFGTDGEDESIPVPNLVPSPSSSSRGTSYTGNLSSVHSTRSISTRASTSYGGTLASLHSRSACTRSSGSTSYAGTMSSLHSRSTRTSGAQSSVHSTSTCTHATSSSGHELASRNSDDDAPTLPSKEVIFDRLPRLPTRKDSVEIDFCVSELQESPPPPRFALDAIRTSFSDLQSYPVKLSLIDSIPSPPQRKNSLSGRRMVNGKGRRRVRDKNSI